jgi:hypothetical protein
MPELAVITPTFRPDAELFAQLHDSVLRFTAPEVIHHVIVPDADEPVFRRHAGPRCRLWTYSELLPRHYVQVKTGVWLNLRRPWPPVRGWVMQQALKIAVTGLIDADTVIMADSDVVLVRPLDAHAVTAGGQPRLHRLDDAVHAGMTRHVQWHHVARRLLGFAQEEELPLPDYVSSLNVWDPLAVRAMQRRIEGVTGKSWFDAFTAQLHISEFILYGVFMDAGLGSIRPPELLDPLFCHNYWTGDALDLQSACDFADRLPSQAVGMMISAKSHTPMDARIAAVRRCAVMISEG